MDKDLMDHGALAYDTRPSGIARDLPDVDLSDHGAIPYAPKSETWGTNDEELIEKLNILMRSSYNTIFEQVIPQLNADSLAKLVEFRYRNIGNRIQDSRHGLSKDEKERIGMELYMDLLMVENMISSNPNSLQPIFNPTLYVGQQELTDIFGVLEKYRQDLDSIGVQIPLIDGSNESPALDSNGNVITAQAVLDYLIAKNPVQKEESTGGKTL